MHEEQEVFKTSGEKYIIFLFLLKTWLSSMNIVTVVASYTFRNKEPVTLLRTVILHVLYKLSQDAQAPTGGEFLLF